MVKGAIPSSTRAKVGSTAKSLKIYQDNVSISQLTQVCNLNWFPSTQHHEREPKIGQKGEPKPT